MNFHLNPRLKSIFINPLIGYVIVAALVFVSFQLVSTENSLKYDQARLQELVVRQNEQDPVKLFFRDIQSDVDRVRVIDKSYSIFTYTLETDLWQQENTIDARLLVFIDDTDPIQYEKEVGDILKFVGTSNTSLLAINLTDMNAALHLSPDAGTKFTDLEAKALIDKTVVPAVKNNRLEYAIASTIQEFNVQLSGNDFYTVSKMKDFSESTSVPGSTKEDDIWKRNLYQSNIREDQSHEELLVVIIALLIAVGLYQIWATRQRTYGFVFGMAVGFSGYMLKTSLNKSDDYIGYENHMLPLIITIALSGLAGLFLDWLISIPKRPAKATSSRIPMKK